MQVCSHVEVPEGKGHITVDLEDAVELLLEAVQLNAEDLCPAAHTGCI